MQVQWSSSFTARNLKKIHLKYNAKESKQQLSSIIEWILVTSIQQMLPAVESLNRLTKLTSNSTIFTDIVKKLN